MDCIAPMRGNKVRNSVNEVIFLYCRTVCFGVLTSKKNRREKIKIIK